MHERAMPRRRVLFLCTGNSARSQMAEAWLRQLGGRWFDAFSAGTHPRPRIHPLAVRAMEEAGIDLSDHWPKDVHFYLGELFDFVITVCERANNACPTFPGDHERIHWSLPDPAEVTGSEAERYHAFQIVRSEIRERVRRFVGAQAPQPASAAP